MPQLDRSKTATVSPLMSSLLALEPRVMFDAAVVSSLAEVQLAEAPPPIPDRSADGTEHLPDSLSLGAGAEPAAPPVQVVFVAAELSALSPALTAYPVGSEVVQLTAGSNALQQMVDYLAGRSGITAIHLLSHGVAGKLQLGELVLDAANLDRYSGQLTAIGQSLASDGDLLLYGCSIAAGAEGQALIGKLASLSQADVAASTDATGAARLGGDWVLERSSGQINVDALSFDFDALLARPVTGTTDFTTSDGNTYNPLGSVVNASPVQGWDFTLQLGSTNNGGQTIIIEKVGSVTTETVDGYSDGTIPISYFSVKSNDSSRFTLNSIGVVLNGFDSGTAGGNLQLVGYINGSAVSGATLTLNVGDVLQGSGGLVTFNVSGNSAFQGIDSFRMLAANGHNVTGMIGIGAINAINFGFAPALTASGGSSAYSSGTGTAVTVDSGITLSDSDSSTQASATVSITGNFHSGEDVLAFTNNGSTMGNIAASYNSGTGVLTLTSSGATATLAQWQAALRAVTYSDSSLSPNTSSRTISFAINDGAINSSVVTKTVTVAADSVPVLGNLNGDNPTFTEKGGAVKLDVGTAVTVTDSDTPNFNSGNLTVHISANGQSGQDVLGVDTSGTVTLSSGTSVGSVVTVGGVSIGVIASNGDGVGGHDLIVTFNSNATPSRVATLLAALTYNNTSNDPDTATRTINVSVNDGRGGTGSGNVMVTVAAVNDAPTGSATASNPTFAMGGAAVQVFSGVNIGTLESSQSVILLTLTVSGLQDSSNEILSIDGSNVALTNGNSVTTSGNGLSVTVALSGGTATVSISSSGISGSTAGSVINGITYQDSSGSPTAGNRVVTLTGVQDNGGTSNGGVDTTSLALASTVIVAVVPVVTTSGGSAAFTAGDNTTSIPVAIDSGLSVTDSASPTLVSASVSITGNFHSGEDVLAFSNTNSSTYGNIAASYNAGTGVLTLTSSGGTATLAQWQAALRVVTYTDSAITPNTATRTISFQVNDGSASSSVVTRTVTVAATDQTPIVSASGGSAAFTAGDNTASTPVAVDPGITLTDADSLTLVSASVSITGNFQSGQDVLVFSNSSALTYGNIAASYNAGTGVLTLTSSGGTATLAQWQAALRAVTYTDSAITPNTATRTISFQVNDGSASSSVVTRTVTVAATDQTPIVSASGGSATFTAGDNTAATPVAVDSGITLTDADSLTLVSASVSITGNFQSGQDVLVFSNSSAITYGNIAASYNAGTGVLTLTSSGGTATLAQWQAALRAVTYTDSAITPNTATRTISFQVNDGSASSSVVTRTVTVAATDQTPIVSASGGSAAFTAGDNTAATPVAVDSGITLTDADSLTLVSASVAITGNFQSGQDVLVFSNSSAITYGNIAASYNAGTGVLTLTSSGGTATLAQWQAALRAVTYTDSAITPNTATRTISFQVNDGSASSSVVTRTVTVAATDQTPIVSASGGSAAFTAGDNTAATPVAVDPGITLTDADSPTLASATVSITGNFHNGEDVLAFSNSSALTYGNIAASYNAGTGVLTLTSSGGTATLAQWQAALRAVTYTDSAITPNTATRTISFQVNDGSASSSVVTRTVTVAATDQTPIVSASGGSAAFTAGDNTAATPVAVDPGITLTDADSPTLASATVSITGNFHNGEDVLAFSNSSALTYGNIAASYNAGTGVLTLTSSGGTATLAQWQAALRAVTYTDSAITPNTATRTVSFSISDGSKDSATVTRTVTVAATDQTPIASASGGSAAFTAGDNTAATPVAVDPGITLTDADSPTLASATVSITGNFHNGEDVLAFSNSSALTYGNIAASYNAGTGVLTLTSSGGTATLAQWQAALRAVTYTDTAITPNTATRTVSFQVNDGSKDSTTVTRTVTVAATDQTPIASASGGSTTFAAGDNTTSTPVAVDSGLTLTDADSPTLASATVSITGNFHSGEDVLAFSNSSALTYGNIAASYNAGTGVLTLTSSGGTATLAQWQAALRAVTYTDSAITPNTATRTVSFSVSDGSKDSATVTRTVTVTATDQTPVATTTGSAGAYVLGGGATAVDSGLTVSDLDSATLASATVAITGNFQSGQDVLAFSNTSAITYGNIAASYNAGTGVLTLTSSGGTATLAQWQAALRAVTYNDTAGTPSTVTRTVSFSISDGSKSSAVMSRSIEMQLPVPSITGLTVGSDTGSSTSDGITSNVIPTVTGSAIANSTVSIYVDNVLIDTTTADGSGAWSYSLVSSLSSGTHSITALTTIGGASSAQSMSYSIMVDSSAPAAPAGLALSTATDSGSSSSDGITSQTMPTVIGTAEANSTVEVYVDGVPVGSVTTDGSGVWSYTLGSALSSGSHSLSAIATDAAGNSSSQSTTYSITVDSSAPTVLAMSLLDDSPTSNSVRYLVSFSEDVEGVDSTDFSLSGSARGSIGGVQQLNARTYIVLVNNVAGSGVLQLNLSDGSVGDVAGNTLAATYNGASYNVIPLAVVVAEPAPEAVVSTPADADVMPVTPNIVLAATGLGGALAPIDTLLPSAPLTEAVQPLLGTSGMPISAVMVNAMQVLTIEVRLPLLIQPLPVGESFSFSLPPGTFSLKHGDGVVMVARQANGQPLPSWMRFDPASGRFSGLMPAGNRQPVEVVVMVRDSQGNQAETRLRLEAARAALEQATAEAPDQGSVASDGQSAVLQEDGQTILPGKLALAEQLARQGNKHFGSAVNALLGAADKVVTRG